MRALLDGILERMRAHFTVALPRTIDEIEQALFKLAERASSNAQQHERFESMREIKAHRAAIATRFMSYAESTLAQVRAPRSQPTPKNAPVSKSAHAPLELVDSSVLDEELAMQEIASKSEIRNSQALFALSHRIGVMAGTPAWTNEALPMGPAQMAAAFRYALHDVKLGIEHRVLAYRQFDRATMLPIAALYQTLNTYLAGQRVLPHLQWNSGRKTGDARDAAAEAAEAAEAATQNEQATEEKLAQNESAGGAAMRGMPNEGGDAELFKTLRHLLGERRRESSALPGIAAASAHASSGGEAGPVAHASRSDLQSVLGSLQKNPDHLSPSNDDAYDSDRFKRELLSQLRRAGPQGITLKLVEEDSDTIDLVGMLFDYITTNVQEGSGARSLLNRLHVPVLRVALGDKTFFTRRSHPARELLNTIAETGSRWMDDTDSDPDLTKKMRVVVDHVGHDFDGDVSVFENMLGDLGKHMQMLARRSEVVERRHIDAAKGRDKLEVARETARSAIGKLLQSGEPTPIVRALLEQAWTDALALSALRQGADSTEFKLRLGVAEKLVRRGSDSVLDAPADDVLKKELDAGMRQVGLHADDVSNVLASVFPPPGVAPVAAAEAVVRVDSMLKEKMRLGGDAAKATPAAAERAKTPLTPAETAMLERLRKTPFGTWFDFIQNQQGAAARRKLAWFSPVTGRCLFVNQRGAHCEDRNLEQLARDMVRGQVRIANIEQTSLIDRAWKAIVETLRPHAADHGGEATA